MNGKHLMAVFRTVMAAGVVGTAAAFWAMNGNISTLLERSKGIEENKTEIVKFRSLDRRVTRNEDKFNAINEKLSDIHRYIYRDRTEDQPRAPPRRFPTRGG